MKKSYFTLILIAFVSIGTFAQTVVRTTTTNNTQTTYRALPSGHDGLNVGASFMIPIYDLNEFASTGVAFDINYVKVVAPMLNMGIATGYSVVFNDYKRAIFDYQKEDVQYIPVALATRYVPSNQIEFGADFGYAIGVSGEFNGGFYYKPLIGFNLNDQMQFNLSFTGISNNSWVTWSTFNIGVMFNLN